MIKKRPASTFVSMAIYLAVVVLFVQTVKAQNTVAQPQKAELYVPTGHTRSVGHVAFSPDGAIVASVGGYLDNTVKLWNIQTGQELRTLVLEAGGTSSAAFSPDVKIIAAGDGDKIALWNVETGLALRTLSGHTSIVTSVAFSPDGKAVASASYDTAVKLWSVETGLELRTLAAHNNRVDSVAFSPDGKLIASGSWDNNIKLWDVVTGREVRTVQTGKAVATVAFSPDGKILASVGLNDKTIKLWSAETGQELRTLTGHTEQVMSVAFSPDGKSISSGSLNHTIKLWSVQTGQEYKTLAGDTGRVNSIAFSPDGKVAAAAEKDSTVIKLWNALTGQELGTLSGHAYGIQSVAFSTDGNMIAVGSEDQTVKLWNAQTGQGIRTLSGHDGWVMSVAFSTDGKTLASGSLDRTIKLWSAETGQELKTLSGKTEGVSSVAFSPDGKILASKSNDETMKLWDVETGEQLKSLAYRDPNARREVFSLVPDFKYYRDNYPFSKDKRFQIKIGDNGKLDLYELKTGKLLGSLVAFDRIDWAVVTPDGLFDGSPSAWKLLSWRLDGNTFRIVPAEAFFNEFYRPGLLADIFAGRRIEKPARDISTIDIRQPEIKVVLSGAKQTVANITTRRATVNVIVKDVPADERRRTGSGAKDVRLFRNGSLVNLWRGDVLKGKGAVTLTATVPLTAGVNNFTAYAFNNENVKSRDGELLVTGADSLKRKGSVYILAIGVNEYANPQYNLKYAVADAHTFTEEIKTQQEKLGQYERVEITSLMDQEATKPNILDAMAKLSAKVQPEDAVFVYFAGHGTAQQNRFYLIPHDLGYSGSRNSVDAVGLTKMLAHSVSDKELEAAFEKVDAGQFLLVIDACNSGQALEAEEKRRGPMNSKGLAQLAYEKGMYILTAAQSFQAAQEVSQVGHGLLTYALVDEGLKQAAADKDPKDGAILVREWLDYATSRVPEMQIDKMKASRGLFFIEEERGLNLTLEKRSGQRPRVFYRRELEAKPLVVARP
jgi:WD40 repeat protein